MNHSTASPQAREALIRRELAGSALLKSTTLAPNPVVVPVEVVWIGRKHGKPAEGDIPTIEVGRGRRDADRRVGWITVGRYLSCGGLACGGREGLDYRDSCPHPKATGLGTRFRFPEGQEAGGIGCIADGLSLSLPDQLIVHKDPIRDHVPEQAVVNVGL